MGRFTLRIKDIIDQYNIFDFTYDLPVGMSKAGLEGEFVAEYVMREIAYETFDIWFIKFKARWLRMVAKYHDVFLMTVDPFTTSRVNVNNQQSTTTSNENINKNIAVPVDSVISVGDVPSEMSQGTGEASGESDYVGETVKQGGSNMDLVNKYAKLKPVIDLFLKEFKDLFFGRY